MILGPFDIATSMFVTTKYMHLHIRHERPKVSFRHYRRDVGRMHKLVGTLL